MPRRTWLDSKIDVFLEELAVSGMHLDRQRVGELITWQVRAVAARMAVTEATARRYLGRRSSRTWPGGCCSRSLANGPALTCCRRRRPFRCRWWGITVAALAGAMQVRAANEPPDHLRDVVTTYAQTLPGFGHRR